MAKLTRGHYFAFGLLIVRRLLILHSLGQTICKLRYNKWSEVVRERTMHYFDYRMVFCVNEDEQRRMELTESTERDPSGGFSTPAHTHSVSNSSEPQVVRFQPNIYLPQAITNIPAIDLPYLGSESAIFVIYWLRNACLLNIGKYLCAFESAML